MTGECVSLDFADDLRERTLATVADGVTAPGRPPPAYEAQFIYALHWGLLGAAVVRVLLV